MLPRNLRRMRSADSWIGRQRILDLVRQAARHLAPGGIALRLQQRGDVVEHQHHAGRAADIVGQRRAGAHQHALAGFGQQFDLFAPIRAARRRGAA